MIRTHSFLYVVTALGDLEVNGSVPRENGGRRMVHCLSAPPISVSEKCPGPTPARPFGSEELSELTCRQQIDMCVGE